MCAMGFCFIAGCGWESVIIFLLARGWWRGLMRGELMLCVCCCVCVLCLGCEWACSFCFLWLVVVLWGVFSRFFMGKRCFFKKNDKKKANNACL